MKDLMHAVSIREPGAADVLEAIEVAVPEPGQRDVLVAVAAAGVNRPDVLQRLGSYPVPADADPLPGLEVAGAVIATGPHVRRWSVGDSVMALTHGGGYAEYCRVHESHCLPLPSRLTAKEGAAIPETFLTVWYNVFMRGQLAPRETLLVHGGSSGIGTTAIQLANAFGAKVIVTAGSDEKCDFCRELGATHAINYRSTAWEEEIMRLTDGEGVDVVLDMVAGPYMQKNLDCLRRDGRYVIIAFLQGPKASLNLRDVLTKRLTISGSTLRPQTIREKAAICRSLETRVMPLLETGAIRPIIHATFPLADARLAHEMMERSEHRGQIVLLTPMSQ